MKALNINVYKKKNTEAIILVHEGKINQFSDMVYMFPLKTNFKPSMLIPPWFIISHEWPDPYS